MHVKCKSLVPATVVLRGHMYLCEAQPVWTLPDIAVFTDTDSLQSISYLHSLFYWEFPARTFVCICSSLSCSSLTSLAGYIILKIILPVVLYGCESWFVTQREEHRLRVFGNRVLMRIFGP
jgi:hypothetical protein